MNILLWIIQIALAFFAGSGGAYKIFSFDEVAKMPSTAAMPRGAWAALGVFEVVCAILLIVPAATKRMPILSAHAAAALAVESVVLAAIFSRYSLKVETNNPLVWVVMMGITAAFVAYGRYVLRPSV